MIIKKLQANSQHLEALYGLDQICFEKAWTREALWEELSHPDALNWACHSSLKLSAALLTRLIANERWIFRIMTHPDYRRQKLAQQLLDSLPQTETIWLEVSVENLNAVNFYQQAGFEIITRRPHYYPEDAFVMRRRQYGIQTT